MFRTWLEAQDVLGVSAKIPRDETHVAELRREGSAASRTLSELVEEIWNQSMKVSYHFHKFYIDWEKGETARSLRDWAERYHLKMPDELSRIARDLDRTAQGVQTIQKRILQRKLDLSAKLHEISDVIARLVLSPQFENVPIRWEFPYREKPISNDIETTTRLATGEGIHGLAIMVEFHLQYGLSLSSRTPFTYKPGEYIGSQYSLGKIEEALRRELEKAGNMPEAKEFLDMKAIVEGILGPQEWYYGEGHSREMFEIKNSFGISWKARDNGGNFLDLQVSTGFEEHRKNLFFDSISPENLKLVLKRHEKYKKFLPI